MAAVTIATEGTTDVPVVRRLLASVGHDVVVVHGGRGKGALDRNLAGYNNAARFAPWMVLRDLDHDAECPIAMMTALLAVPAEHMRLRIAVREMESWLIADRDAIAEFLSVRTNVVPANPDALDDPKLTLVNLARRSRRRGIREDMVPAPGTSGVVGPAYASRLNEFARDHWRPAVAATSSPSLRRSIDRLAASWIGLP